MNECQYQLFPGGYAYLYTQSSMYTYFCKANQPGGHLLPAHPVWASEQMRPGSWLQWRGQQGGQSHKDTAVHSSVHSHP